MARPLRIEYPGACYHVINRGNYRRGLFLGKGAAEAFERTLGEAAKRFGWRVHAYVIMSNHFHLAVEITEPNLSEGMKWLQGTWIRRYNGFRGLMGRPFQGRYKALIVEPGHALAQVCHYIHLNPVRARICAPGEAVRYGWSSLPKFVAGETPAWLVAETVLRESGGLPDNKRGWKKYLEYLEFLGTDEVRTKELVAKRMSRGWCIGGHQFKRDLKEEAKKRGAELDRFAGLEPDHVRSERRDRWEEQLQEFARRANIDLNQLSAPKSHPDKALLAAALKQRTSASNGWLAERLGMGKPASASQFARRWLLNPKGRKAVEALLSRVKA